MNNTPKKYKVWVVDDEIGIYLGISRILKDYTVLMDDDEEAAFEVEAFDTGEAFLARLEQEQPNILLLDNKLPGIQGIEILEELNNRNLSVLTIMITAYATFDKAVLATKLGAFDFLAKPFTPDELRYAVRKASKTLVLTEKARRLEEAKKKVRFEFISVLAHELKSPINAVEGYADIMLTRQAGTDMAAYDPMFRRIKVRTSAMRKLIVDLLDLTRIESGGQARKLERLDLHDLVRGVIENVKELANEKEVQIHFESSGEPFYAADRVEMEMLLTNFMTNGIKYNKEKGTLQVTLTNDGRDLTLAFADTGVGMTEEEQKMLFKEFSRIKNRKTRGIEGSGLGLSIVHKIVSLYEGRIEVRSQPDVGSTFRVVLPASDRQAAPSR